MRRDSDEAMVASGARGNLAQTPTTPIVRLMNVLHCCCLTQKAATGPASSCCGLECWPSSQVVRLTRLLVLERFCWRRRRAHCRSCPLRRWRLQRARGGLVVALLGHLTTALRSSCSHVSASVCAHLMHAAGGAARPRWRSCGLSDMVLRCVCNGEMVVALAHAAVTVATAQSTR